MRALALPITCQYIDLTLRSAFFSEMFEVLMVVGSPLLVIDLGGTNIRFAVCDYGNKTLRQQESYECCRFADLSTAIKHYLRVMNLRVSQAVIAVATAVSGDQVELLNLHWKFSISALQAELQLSELRVINDFTAIALSLPYLSESELQQIGGESSMDAGVKGLLGPGTGLGVSGLIHSGRQWLPLQCEGGHVTATAATEREQLLLLELYKKYEHVSWERLLSGPGLVNIYQGLCVMDQQSAEPLSPAEITDAALAKTCKTCEEALLLFCSFLGSAAGDLALTLGTMGGIYIAGGIVPRFTKYLSQSPFRQRFESKGRLRKYLTSIPCFVVHSTYPGLIGASVALTTSLGHYTSTPST